MNKISLIIFDMDGLMFDTEKLAISAWIEAGKCFDINIPESVVIETIGLDVHGAEKVFKKHLGDNFTFFDVRKLRIEYAKDFIEKNGIPIKKGLYELLEFLDEKDVLKAVATSTERERAKMLLSTANIENKFDIIICGDDISKGKPEPDIFLAVSRKLGCNPQECLVLEDSENGIIAASKANMIPILIPDIKNPSIEIEKLAFKKFNSLIGVKDFIEAMDYIE